VKRKKCGCISDADTHMILDVDYSNLELFVAHHYSNDDNLLKALTEFNFHTYTASQIFETPYDEVTGFQRFNSKFVTFGIAYGRQAWSLSQGELKELTGGSEQRTQMYIDRFWEGYPGYKEVYDRWQYDAIHKGELTTPLGRKRRWRIITPQTINHIKNQAVNFPIQSLASDICLSALIRLARILPEKGLGHVLFTVHDSLVFEVPADRMEEAIAVITYEMERPPFDTNTPFKVDIDWGPSLGDVQKWQPAA